jgi:hypothetical protein
MDRMAAGDCEEGPIHDGVVTASATSCLLVVKNGFQRRVSVSPARVLVDLARPVRQT